MSEPIHVIGAGIAGLCCALECLKRGFLVHIYEKEKEIGAQACSWYAGGMLAPWCEAEHTPEFVRNLGVFSLNWWKNQEVSLIKRGSLVVAASGDRLRLEQFAKRTGGKFLDRAALGQLEPDLAERSFLGVFFSDEAHLDPRCALRELQGAIERLGGRFFWGQSVFPTESLGGNILDCRGLSAREALGELRGVKGEMLVLRSSDLSFSRPIRLLHPRFPVYIVPRGEGVYMVGATALESETPGVSVRSALELLTAVYTLHPAFSEAEILEVSSSLRPTFLDHFPQIHRRGSVFFVNGFFRHGFLLAPAVASFMASFLKTRGHHGNHCEWERLFCCDLNP